MPCGFVYTVLLLAWLSMDPLRSAAIMLAFGLGTVPALLALQWRAQALRRALAAAGPQRWRRVGGALLLGLAALQLAAPLLAPHLAAGLHAWLPFDCGPLR
jgi:sulfite exporter TauE/SafE